MQLHETRRETVKYEDTYINDIVHEFMNNWLSFIAQNKGYTEENEDSDK